MKGWEALKKKRIDKWEKSGKKVGTKGRK